MWQTKRWLVAIAALLVGGGVSAALLVIADPSRNSTDVYIAARELAAGSVLGPGSVVLERVSVPSGRSILFGHGDQSRLEALRASHDLVSGQLIQRGDVTESATLVDRRLVFLPLKDVPAAAAGSRVDLLVIAGTADRPTVVPFALGVEVGSNVSGGLVVVVSSKQAPAFVYAATAMHLAAVIAEPGTADGSEGAISSPDQAIAIAAQP